jgi:hypothetical protein
MPGHVIETIGSNVIIYTEEKVRFKPRSPEFKRKTIPKYLVASKQEKYKLDKNNNHLWVGNTYSIFLESRNLEAAREQAR